MKRIATIICCILAITASAAAQNLSDVFKGNEALSKIFVNPMGIDNVLDQHDANALKADLDKLGLTYQTRDLGNYGEAFAITPSGFESFEIGGVPVARMVIMVQDSFNGLMFMSEPSDNYLDLCSYIDNALSGISKRIEGNAADPAGLHQYMLTDTCGIGVIPVPQNKTSIVMLMDIRNLMGFISLYGLTAQ